MDAPTVPAISREPLPPRKKPSISSWVLKIIGACSVGFLLGVIWLAATSPKMDRLLRLMGEQRHMVQEEMTAPGAREVAKAGPCAQALIMSPEIRKRMRAQGRRRSRAKEPPADETIVTCVPPVFRDPPACDVLARAYVDAAHPSGPFRINVAKSLRAKAACSVDYDSSGMPIALDGGI